MNAPLQTKAVTSLSNATVKAVRALHMRKEREESGLFLAEGRQVLDRARKRLPTGTGAMKRTLLRP